MTSIVKNVVQWGSQPKPRSPAKDDLCEICGKKPKFVEKGYKHQYCSRGCAARTGQGPSPTACLLQGCRATGKPAFSGFCTDAHAKEGVRLSQVKACDTCHLQPQSKNGQCISCERRSLVATPRLREVNCKGTTFKQVRAQFNSEWDSDSPAKIPVVEKVYEITIPRDVRARYEAYRAARSAPQEIRTFHSSQCICDMGTKEAVLCSFKSCGICSIVKSSFKAFAFGASSNNGRFGDGIYSYRNPSLADGFATSCTSSPYRVTIACDVILESNVEESVFVATADAIIPAYVIMYTV